VSKDKTRFSIQNISPNGAFRKLTPGVVVVELKSYRWLKRNLILGTPETTEKDNMYSFRSINDAKRAIGRYCKINNNLYAIQCQN
jgi:hypothetical protein